ncbi:Proteasome subunit alpha type-2 [Morus notabilis]|uniref:Proteasome subunit alpha type-2 n=1 Tax=Morus notabilis TaxID=981085 RepID=W9RGU3_9ROSA|nr:Proteasome subunit alpha type-2 [Morus notabilis]
MIDIDIFAFNFTIEEERMMAKSLKLEDVDITQNFLPLTWLFLLSSPSRKLAQIEHSLTAVGSGQTSLEIKAANGVVIATEKKLPSILVDETSVSVYDAF